jgi:hypothetical protein
VQHWRVRVGRLPLCRRNGAATLPAASGGAKTPFTPDSGDHSSTIGTRTPKPTTNHSRRSRRRERDSGAALATVFSSTSAAMAIFWSPREHTQAQPRTPRPERKATTWWLRRHSPHTSNEDGACTEGKYQRSAAGYDRGRVVVVVVGGVEARRWGRGGEKGQPGTHLVVRSSEVAVIQRRHKTVNRPALNSTARSRPTKHQRFRHAHPSPRHPRQAINWPCPPPTQHHAKKPMQPHPTPPTPPHPTPPHPTPPHPTPPHPTPPHFTTPHARHCSAHHKTPLLQTHETKNPTPHHAHFTA